jgi:hypothetical protein
MGSEKKRGEEGGRYLRLHSIVSGVGASLANGLDHGGKQISDLLSSITDQHHVTLVDSYDVPHDARKVPRLGVELVLPFLVGGTGVGCRSLVQELGGLVDTLLFLDKPVNYT